MGLFVPTSGVSITLHCQRRTGHDLRTGSQSRPSTALTEEDTGQPWPLIPNLNVTEALTPRGDDSQSV